MANKKSKFELVIGAVSKVAGPFARIQAAFSALGKRAGELRQKLQYVGKGAGFSALADQIAGVAGRLKRLKAEGAAAIGRVTGAVGKLSLAFGAAGGGALALVKSVANAGDAAAKSAARAGTSIAVWQEYAHAASLSDVNEEALAKGFRKLQDTAIKAVQGGKTQASLFKLAGIDPKNEKGEVKNAESLFLELSDKIKSLADAGKNAQATNLLTGMFGDKGASLMPMLSGGAEALKELRKEAHDLGLVFSDEDAHASEAFGDALTRVGQVLQGIGNAIGRALLPFITKLADKFTATAKGAHAVIGAGFAEWVESIDIDRLFDAIESGLSTLKNFWASLQAGVKWLGGWGTVLKGVAAIILGKVVLALAALSGSFLSLGLAIMATPIGWIMGAIALLAGAGYLLVQKWDAISAWWSGFWGGIKERCGQALDEIKEFLSMFNPLPLLKAGLEKVKNFFAGFSLEGGARGIIAGVMKVLALFSPVGLFMEAWKKVAGLFEGCSLAEAGRKIMDSLLGGLKKSWDKVAGFFSDVKSKVAGLFSFGGDEKGDENRPRPAFPMADPMNLAPAAAGIVSESIQKTETVERNEVNIVVSSRDQTPVEAALSGKSGGAVSLDTGRLMGAAQ